MEKMERVLFAGLVLGAVTFILFCIFLLGSAGYMVADCLARTDSRFC